MDFVNEQHTWNELGDALIDIPVMQNNDINFYEGIFRTVPLLLINHTVTRRIHRKVVEKLIYNILFRPRIPTEIAAKWQPSESGFS